MGLKPPDTVAWSEIESPTVTPADAVVERLGVACATTTDSVESVHDPLTTALLASPL